MVVKCKTEGCNITACFGVTKRSACSQHKTPDMVNLSNPKCPHGKLKSRCIDCDGGSMCPHGRSKYECIPCGGTQICEHLKQKPKCLQCGGSQLCQCGQRKSDRYDGWCASCFHTLYPDDPRSVNTNDAELRLDQHLQVHPQVKAFSKTPINCGGRNLVPDAIVEIEGGGTIMVELDGPQHFARHSLFHSSEEEFQDQVQRDCAKNLYAKDQGWSILRISFREYKSLEQIVDRFIADFVVKGRKQLFHVSNAQLYNSIVKL